MREALSMFYTFSTAKKTEGTDFDVEIGRAWRERRWRKYGTMRAETLHNKPSDMKFIRLHVRSLFLLTALLAPWLLCLCDLAFGPSITDSSVFRYMGWRFATGTGGYARAWDCKGPVLVLFNAVGYWLGISPSVIFASVWSGIVFLFFRFLKRLRVAEPEGWTLLFFLLFVHMEGSLLMNGTETLAAFFSLVAVHSVWGARSPFRWLAVGAAAGAVFFTKANLISFAAALGLACAFQSVRTREFGRLAACFLCSLAGFAAVVAAVSLLFGSGGFREMWDAAIGYNLLERCAGVRQSYLGYWADRLFRQMWYLISAASFSAWAALGALLIVVGLSRSLRAPDARKAAYLTLTAWLILEMAMAFCSKGFYMHYTMVSVVPMLALLSLCVSDTPAFMTGGGGASARSRRCLPAVLRAVPQGAGRLLYEN